MSSFYIKENIGKYFKATIKKELVLPNGKLCYLFEDEFGMKHTLPKESYIHYNFKKGDEINIRLDHINCDNRLFFEPENPIYKETYSYNFSFKSFSTEVNYLGFEEKIALVIDKLGFEQKVRFASNISVNNNSLKAYVALIKKGRLFLVASNAHDLDLKPNTIAQFKVIDQRNTNRFGETLIVIDKKNNKHGIPAKYYSQYNLKEKAWFNGEIQKISSKGFLYIEPLHPKYEIGSSYAFKIFNKLKHKKQQFYFVEDCYGNIVKVKVSNDNKNTGDILSCEVYGLKKGVPQLKI